MSRSEARVECRATYSHWETPDFTGWAWELPVDLAVAYAMTGDLTTADYAMLADEARDAVARAVRLICRPSRERRANGPR